MGNGSSREFVLEKNSKRRVMEGVKMALANE